MPPPFLPTEFRQVIGHKLDEDIKGSKTDNNAKESQ